MLAPSPTAELAEQIRTEGRVSARAPPITRVATRASVHRVRPY